MTKTARAFELYHGSDWTTYRWSVAQAFDTLDRLREVCAPLLPPDMAEDFLDLDVLGVVEDLCDDLVSEIETAAADLAPVLTANVACRWSLVEIRIHLEQVRTLAGVCDIVDVQEHLAHLALCGDRIRDLLKKMDV